MALTYRCLQPNGNVSFINRPVVGRSYPESSRFSPSGTISAASWLAPIPASAVAERDDSVGLPVELKFQEMFGLCSGSGDVRAE